MKLLKTVGITLLVLVVLIFGALLAFRIIMRQEIAEDYEVNSPDLETKVLIATQGSEFKHSLVGGVVDNLKMNEIYLKVIDVTGLGKVDASEWHSILIVNTCEAGKLQKDTAGFLDRYPNKRDIILLTTSGEGTWMPENVNADTISAASEQDQVDNLRQVILAKITAQLKE